MDLSERIAQTAGQQRALAGAVEDIVRRGVDHFTTPPTDAELSTWVATLKASAPFFFAPAQAPLQGPEEHARQEVLAHLSPSERLTRARAGQPPVRRKRPEPVPLSEAQVKELSSLPAMQRLSRYRALQAEQGRADGAGA
jgi:hypothetical protein